MARAVTRNQRLTKLVEKSAIPRSTAAVCSHRAIACASLSACWGIIGAIASIGGGPLADEN
jgi:hypothetical protein